VRPLAISADTPEESRALIAKAGYTFPLLSDRSATAIRRYDLLHKGAGENGRDIARPAEFLVDRSGTVRWRNLTEDFRVRARPEQLLAAARTLSAAK
jgi:peroxiredoxin